MTRPSSRVTKRTSSSRIITRQRSRLAAETSATGAASLQRMVDEATYGLQDGNTQLRGEDASCTDYMDSNNQTVHERSKASHIANEDRRFPLMSLPAEIRNEIYRACLTRPFNILLSRKERDTPPPESMSDSCEREQPDRPEQFLIEDLEREISSTATSYTRSARLYQDYHFAARTGSVRYSSRLGSPSASSSSSSNNSTSAGTPSRFARQGSATSQRNNSSSRFMHELYRAPRPQDDDPLLVGILRLSKQVYQEARSILYNENCFTLDLETARPTLAALHQRSRRQIKYVELEIPCYNEILERFQETVRLSLRYCWGLKTCVVHMPFTLPGADGSGTTGNTTVYANGFDILRWLPRQCEVVLKGNICSEISAVVSKNANLAKSLDELAYARRQLISNETDRN